MGRRSAFAVFTALALASSGAMALELKNVVYETDGAGKVVFSHAAHLKAKNAKGVKMTCKSCHESANAPKVKATMADMEKGKSCGKCHDGKHAFAVAQCTGCHKVKNITYKIKQTGPVHFSHANHLKSMQCTACHDAIFTTGHNPPATMAEMKKGKSCGACHNGNKAFSIDRCEACHPSPKQVVFKVRQTGPTVFDHGKHAGLYSCGKCHSAIYSLSPSHKPVSMAAMQKGKSCGACHNAKEAFALAKCDKCHPVREINFKVAKAGDVKFSHTSHLQMHKCQECHTRTFPTKSGNKPVSMSEMKKGKSCGACHDGKGAFTVNGNCDSCHVRG